jgi:hypothetical protein
MFILAPLVALYYINDIKKIFTRNFSVAFF